MTTSDLVSAPAIIVPTPAMSKQFRAACAGCGLAALCLPGVDLAKASDELAASGQDTIMVAVSGRASTCEEARASLNVPENNGSMA